MRQFIDRVEWKDHIHNHHHNDLEDDKALICPLHALNCSEAFESLKELNFHLEDVHCLDLTRKSKRSSPTAAGVRPTKCRRPNRNFQPNITTEDAEYEFVDESDRCSGKDRSLTLTSTIRASRASKPISDFDISRRATNRTPLLSLCGDSEPGIHENARPVNDQPATLSVIGMSETEEGRANDKSTNHLSAPSVLVVVQRARDVRHKSRVLRVIKVKATMTRHHPLGGWVSER